MLKKGPGFVPCSARPAQATATFRLTVAGSPDCSTGPCGRLSLSPSEGPPGTLVTVTGWAPLTDVMIGDRPFGYNLALQRAGGSPDNPWLWQVQQAPDGTVTGSFRVPVAQSALGRLSPGAYTLALQMFVNNARVSSIRPAPGLTITPLSKGGSTFGARVTLAPTTFTITAGPTWASLGQLKPLRAQWSARLYGGSAVIGDPANPRRLAYCTAGGIQVSADGGTTWHTLPTTGAIQAVAPTPFQFFQVKGTPPACLDVLPDPAHPASFFATFAVVKKRQQNPPPENLIGLVTTNAGQSWHVVLAPSGYTLAEFGGFQAAGQAVVALYGRRLSPAGSTRFAVEKTADGGLTWTLSKLSCPVQGPCVRWGPAPSSIGGMGVGYPQEIEVSTDGGKSWTSPSWPRQVFLNQGPSELVALSPSEVALVSGASPYPLVVSRDSGQTWADVALPSLGAGSGGSQLSGLQMLPNGALLAHGDSGPGWLLLTVSAQQWCAVTGASLPASVPSFWAIGGRLWWVQTAGTPMEPRTVGSVAISDLRCGQAISSAYRTPMPTAK